MNYKQALSSLEIRNMQLKACRNALKTQHSIKESLRDQLADANREIYDLQHKVEQMDMAMDAMKEADDG